MIVVFFHQFSTSNLNHKTMLLRLETITYLVLVNNFLRLRFLRDLVVGGLHWLYRKDIKEATLYGTVLIVLFMGINYDFTFFIRPFVPACHAKHELPGLANSSG